MVIFRFSEKQKFKVSGLIVACFGKEWKRKLEEFDLEIEEKFENDPWIASAKSKEDTFLTKEELVKIVSDYRFDPDKKNVPYYFAVKSSGGSELIIYNDDGVLVPINSKSEKDRAKEIGLKKGLIKDQLDF